MTADSRRPREAALSGPLGVRANASAASRQWALYVVQEGADGPVGALRVDSLNPDAVIALVNRSRLADGGEGEDTFIVAYEGHRGMYANGYACARARVPAHADAVGQVALRSQCHASDDGEDTVIFAAALSDNTHQFEVRANGEYRAPTPRWLNATLHANVTAGDGSIPGTSREGARVFFRGRPAWTAQTLTSATVLLTVDEEHRPTTAKSFSVRTSPDSNIAAVLDLAANGQLTNRSSFGTGTTAYLPLDGLNYSLD